VGRKIVMAATQASMDGYVSRELGKGKSVCVCEQTKQSRLEGRKRMDESVYGIVLWEARYQLKNQ
jgi:hypothetical protein